MPNKFCLEVVRYSPHQNDNTPRFVHVGYMNKWFKTRREAVEYYDNKNPHMRSIKLLSTDGHTYTYKSDWDPENGLAYIVREFYGIDAHISPFPE